LAVGEKGNARSVVFRYVLRYLGYVRGRRRSRGGEEGGIGIDEAFYFRFKVFGRHGSDMREQLSCGGKARLEMMGSLQLEFVRLEFISIQGDVTLIVW
jgi:hypothetical protein